MIHTFYIPFNQKSFNMKKLLLIIIISFSINLLKVNAQYSIDAGKDTTISCGGAADLFAKVSDWVLLRKDQAGQEYILSSVYFLNADTGFVVGNYGIILKTTNGGISWTELICNTWDMMPFNSVFFTNIDTGYIAGYWGLVKTIDGGNNWTFLNTGTTGSLSSIYFTNDYTGYVAGDGKILKTTDAVVTWNQLSTQEKVYKVYFVNFNLGFARGINGTILKTTNAGNTWQSLNTGVSWPVTVLCFPDENTGYALGYVNDDPKIIKTTDGGKSWTEIIAPQKSMQATIYFTDANTGYFFKSYEESEQQIFKTTDGGISWTCSTPELTYYGGIKSIFFTNSNTGYGVGGSGQIIKYKKPQQFSYSWSPSEGLNATNIPNPVAKPSITTIYTVTVTTDFGLPIVDSVKVNYNNINAIEICYVEFDTLTYKNKINWSTNISEVMDSIHIYSEVSTDVWKLIGTVSSKQNNFIDMGSNPFNQSYSYKISVKDTCGNETVYSDSHTTITLLSMFDQGTNAYGFTWSAYKGINISNYYLYGVKSDGKEIMIGSVPGNQYFYNYTNPYPGFIKYFIGFNTSPCNYKSNHLVKSNYVQIFTGINDNDIINNIVSVYPNPAKDLVDINFKGFIEKDKISINLYNVTGGLIETIPFESPLTKFDISDLSKGVYILKISNKNSVAFKKIVKE